MNTIYYFNINYSCNNKCVFCFSHNTGKNGKNIEFDQFVQTLQSVSPDETDKIILNGGEPSIHPFFYEMLNFIESHFYTNTVVYTNGTMLKIDELKGLRRTLFVIPIHGDRIIHNGITRNEMSYNQTFCQIKRLQCEKLRYAIKFILNKQLVESRFDIRNFLQINDLHPDKVFLARLVETKKALENCVQYPLLADLQEYLRKCHESLKNEFELIYLDVPLCFLINEAHELHMPVAPSFFYSDYQKKIVKKDYRKEIKILGNLCERCSQKDVCSLMQNSYLTLAYGDAWMLAVE